MHAFSEESFMKSPLSPAGKEHAERGPGYISEADQFAKGGFGEVWRATRQTKGGMPSSDLTHARICCAPHAFI